MGILMDEKVVQREKRYTGLNIQKLTNGESIGTIIVEIGYYSEFNGVRRWVTETQETMPLSNDQLGAMMMLKHGDLGLTTTKLTLFTFLDTAIYAVMGGQIPMRFKYELTVTDTDGNPVKDYIATLKSKRGVVQSMYALATDTVTLMGDITIDAEISVTKDGYEPLVYTVPMLKGEEKVTKQLVVIAAPTPTPTTEPAPTEPPASE